MVRAIDPRALTDPALATLITNHKRHRAFDETYRAALDEHARRGATILDMEKTLAVVAEAATEGRFLSYLEIANANGVSWDRARYAIFRHLGDLLDVAHARKMPLLTAIIVAKPHLKDGKMDAPTLAGFVTAARELGFAVEDEQQFLLQQQAATFAYFQKP